MFVDLSEIQVQAGRGGSGAVSFRREKYVPKGGPDGGDGGKGGDILFIADRNLTTLMDFKYKRSYKAGHGHNGKGKKMSGREGENQVIKVPVGTVVREKATDEILMDLNRHSQKFVVSPHL
jgi:GTP-binding protein